MGAGIRRLLGVMVALVAGCGSCDEDAPSASTGARTDAEECSAGVWGVPAVDRLVSGGGRARDPHGAPLLYETSVEALLASSEADALTDALHDVAGADLDALPVPARATLQHDLWGLTRRLEEQDASSERLEALLLAARAAATHAAPTPAELGALSPRDADATVARYLPPSDGWVERGSEMPVLGHERHFGLRRIFRVFERPATDGDEPDSTDRDSTDGDEPDSTDDADLHTTGPRGRALASQLVALDRDGTPHLTPVVGEIEILSLDGADARGERVLHLDRRRLRCDGPAGALVDVTDIAHIPGLGADSFLVELAPPVPLADNPCARCHEDAFPMSLPSPDIDPRAREQRLLRQIADLLDAR